MIGLDLEQSKIRFLIGTNNGGVQRLFLSRSTLKVDLHGIRAGHYMVVGHDVAVGRDDEAGPEGTLGALPGPASVELLEEPLEIRRKSAEHFGRQCSRLIDFFFSADVDDRLSRRLYQRYEIGQDRGRLYGYGKHHDEHGGCGRNGFEFMQHSAYSFLFGRESFS